MKYVLDLKCGHSEPIEINGSGVERTEKVKWYENNSVCRKCFNKLGSTDSNIVDYYRYYKLDNLVGTDKQVKWANDIRNKVIDGFCDSLLDIVIKNPNAGSSLKKDNGLKSFFKWLISNTDAKFWIDNRGHENNTRYFVKLYTKGSN